MCSNLDQSILLQTEILYESSYGSLAQDSSPSGTEDSWFSKSVNLAAELKLLHRWFHMLGKGCYTVAFPSFADVFQNSRSFLVL